MQIAKLNGAHVIAVASGKHEALLRDLGADVFIDYSIVQTNVSIDAAIKWLICVLVVIAVDILWLWLGSVVGKAALKPATERVINIVTGATIAGTAFLALSLALQLRFTKTFGSMGFHDSEVMDDRCIDRDDA